MLDAAGFPEVRIVASNELDEFVIDSIRDEGGRVDIYGVGTKLATCGRNRRRCPGRRLQTGGGGRPAENEDHQRHRQGDPAGQQAAAAGRRARRATTSRIVVCLEGDAVGRRHDGL